MAKQKIGSPRRFRWTSGLIAGIVMMSVMVLIAIFAPIFLTTAADTLGPRAQPPGPEHWLGTDAAGHDMLARSLVATRLTLLMTLGATALSVGLGVVLGTVVWTLPHRVRQLLLRAIDALVAFPPLLIALVVAAILGAGIASTVVAIGVANAPYFARLTANLAGSIARREFVVTSTLLGVPRRRIVLAHLLPNMSEPLLVLSASNFAQSLTAISALSFVGLGVQSPDYDWGKLLNSALPSLLSGRPLEMVGPAALIIITGVAATLIGDGLAAAANPRSGSRRQARIGRRATAVDARESQPLVEVDNLVITAPDGRRLVDGVSVRIGAGEIVGLVGESGSGKSLTAMTLAKLLPDGLDASVDRMRLDGIDLTASVPRRELALRVGLVYQDPGTTFAPTLRLGGQLTQVMREHQKLSRAESRRRIIAALEAVRMTSPARRLRQHPHELSGGMRQRAMIASAIAAGPQLLIADEPTTALDVTVQAEILRHLKEMNTQENTSILFISHDLAVVRALCDRVMVMYAGKVVEELPSASLTLEGATHAYTRRLLAATPTVADDVAPAVEPGAGERIETEA